MSERFVATRSPGLRAILLVGFFAFLMCVLPRPALAVGPNAVMYPTGWNTNAVARGDDTANLVVNLPFAMNWMGTNYSQLYLNMNGSVTFGSGFTSYTPGALSAVGQGIMAPYWADVDTRYVGAPNQMYYSNITSGSVPAVNGHKAFLVTWSNVMRYNGATQSSDTTDTFQLIIVDRSDTGAGNFDFMYNYDKVVWDMGTASTTHARAGWAVNATTSYELPGSGSTTGGLLDSGPASTSLIKNSLNSGGQLGRYVWQVRGATAPNAAPTIGLINRVLEGNVANGYASYNATASGDASATDTDGSIASFVCTPSLPATLPLGITNILWTATDNRAAVTTATQSVTVTDTTPPTLSTLTCPTHTAGVWSKTSAITMNWTTATDVCSGLNGYSVSWSQNATAMPDTTLDASSSTNTTSTTLSDGSWYFNLRTVDKAGNWSATAVSFGPIRIDTVKPTTTSNAPSSWASATVSVVLTASDPSGPVAYTRYKLDASAVATYSVAVSVSGDGTHTLLFWSADSAGNVEATNTATIRIDTTAPSTPTSVTASAVGTTSAEVTWTGSTDNVSGVAYYAIYRNGSIVATTSATTYTDTGLSAGFTYPYYVVAVNAAGMRSANSNVANATMPSAEIWMSMSTDTVDMGAVSPGAPSTLASATTVKVGGVGALTYDFWCSAVDFSNSATSSVTPTMPVSALSYSTSGWVSVGLQPFVSTPYKLDTATGSKYVWEHDYQFGYVLNAPWAFDPGTYTTTVTYTVVSR
ncbi:MAG: hypothetical protein P4L93_08650 [Coriobacteriia bacterium]|nr:hypothetical protein [Coriobacteriia bacterium]